MFPQLLYIHGTEKWINFSCIYNITLFIENEKKKKKLVAYFKSSMDTNQSQAIDTNNVCPFLHAFRPRRLHGSQKSYHYQNQSPQVRQVAQTVLQLKSKMCVELKDLTEKDFIFVFSRENIMHEQDTFSYLRIQVVFLGVCSLILLMSIQK